jgi:hypothetical protein
MDELKLKFNEFRENNKAVLEKEAKTQKASEGESLLFGLDDFL